MSYTLATPTSPVPPRESRFFARQATFVYAGAGGARVWVRCALGAAAALPASIAGAGEVAGLDGVTATAATAAGMVPPVGF